MTGYLRTLAGQALGEAGDVHSMARLRLRLRAPDVELEPAAEVGFLAPARHPVEAAEHITVRPPARDAGTFHDSVQTTGPNATTHMVIDDDPAPEAPQRTLPPAKPRLDGSALRGYVEPQGRRDAAAFDDGNPVVDPAPSRERRRGPDTTGAVVARQGPQAPPPQRLPSVHRPVAVPARAAAPARSAAPAPAALPDVHIHIGRVELAALVSEPARGATPSRDRQPQSLEQYFRHQNGRTR